MQMCPNGTQAETELREQQMRPTLTQILPTSERQVRPLTKLEPQQQQEVWQRAVQVAGGKVKSARIAFNFRDQSVGAGSFVR